MEKTYIKDGSLIIEIPLKTRRTNCYMESKENPTGDIGGMDHVVGIVDNEEIGFGFWIDMNYKGKPDQYTGILYDWLGGQEDFEKFCKESKISVISIKESEDERNQG